MGEKKRLCVTPNRIVSEAVTYTLNKTSLFVCVCFLINRQDNQGISVVLNNPKLKVT